MKEPKVMTYDEWLVEYYPDWEDEDEVDCPDCDGKGVVECYTCGAETLECETCKGEGLLENKDTHLEEYKNLRASELEAWKKWNEKRNI
jgi:RecJ-like exonuclease